MDWRPNVLVLGPGGTKGYLELGALKHLEDIKFIDDVDTVVGCSVGSIIGLLLVAGLSVDDIINISEERDFMPDIFDFKSISSLSQIIEKSGIMSNSKIKESLSQIMINRYGKIPTLGELFSNTGIDFTVISYNLTQHRSENFSHTTHPNVSCVEATLLSSNVPLLFHMATYNNQIYIDGAMGNPYPVDLYDGVKKVNAKNNDDVNDILGLYIMHDVNYYNEKSIFTYINSIIDAPVDELRKKTIESVSSRCKHLELKYPSNTIGLSNVSKQCKKEMIQLGYNAAKNFVAKNIKSNI